MVTIARRTTWFDCFYVALFLIEFLQCLKLIGIGCRIDYLNAFTSCACQIKIQKKFDVFQSERRVVNKIL